MNELSESKKAKVEKANTTSHEEQINVAKNHIPKHPLVVKIATHLLLFTICLVIVNYVFRISVTEITLSNTISLGAIFATFGAALISIFTVVEKDKFDRVVTNIEILYIDILKEKRWRRWQFLKRKGFHKNMNNTVFNSNLENDSVVFNIGSHLIAIYIPTVVEDFYDLPSYSEVWLMLKNRSHFYTSMSDKGDKSIEGTNFNTWLDQYFAWGCLYDIWKSAVSIKISRLFLIVGVYIIFTSILYAFFFQVIQSL